MKIAIVLSREQERKALPLLLKHSPGALFRGGIYLLEPPALEILRESKIAFRELTSKASAPELSQLAGEGV